MALTAAHSATTSGTPLATASLPSRDSQSEFLASFSGINLDSLYESIVSGPAASESAAASPIVESEYTLRPVAAPRGRSLMNWKSAAAMLTIVAGIAAWFALRSGTSEAPKQDTPSRLTTGDTPAPDSTAPSTPATPATVAAPPAVVADTAGATPSEPTPTTVLEPSAAVVAAPTAPPIESNPVLEELQRAMGAAPGVAPRTSPPESSAPAPVEEPAVSEKPTESPMVAAPTVEAPPLSSDPAPVVIEPAPAVPAAPVDSSAPTTTESVEPGKPTVVAPAGTGVNPVLEELHNAMNGTPQPVVVPAQPSNTTSPTSDLSPAHEPVLPVDREFQRLETAPRGTIITPLAPIETRFMIPTGSARLSELFPEEQPMMPIFQELFDRRERASLAYSGATLEDRMPADATPLIRAVVEDVSVSRTQTDPDEVAVLSGITLDELVPDEPGSEWLRAYYRSIRERVPSAVVVRRRSAPQELASRELTTTPSSPKGFPSR